jgi:signal transduction histidine kinase/CheY-like chemotaxis protein
LRIDKIKTPISQTTLNELLSFSKSALLILDSKGKKIFSSEKFTEILGQHEIPFFYGSTPPNHPIDFDYLIDSHPIGPKNHINFISKSSRISTVFHLAIRNNKSSEIRQTKLMKKHYKKEGLDLLLFTVEPWDIQVKEQAAQPTPSSTNQWIHHQNNSFLFNMHHEIKKPLNIILGMIEILNWAPLDSEYRHYTQTLNLAAQNLLTLINDVMDLSKFETMDFQIENRSLDLNHLIHSITSVLAVRARDKKIRLYSTIDKNLTKPIVGDPQRIHQILMNLLVNALKFTEQGEIEVRADIIDHESEKSILISVRDTGIGIEEDRLDSIFEKFNQGSTDISEKFGGGGLGLTLCKYIASAMSGEIKVTSKKNVGSNFSLKIPFIHAPTNEHLKTTDEMSSIAVYGVEGVHVNAILRIIENLNYNGIPCTTEKDVLDCVASEKADLVVLDLSNPHMDAIRTARRIRSRKIKTPILFHSGSCSSEVSDIAHLGNVSYCPAPYADKDGFIKELMIQVNIGFEERPNRLLNRIGRINVLLVEDNTDTRTLIQAYLKDSKISITSAENGKNAFDICNTNTFDLIIMDQYMPIMDGLSAGKEIHRRQSETHVAETPIILLATNTSKEKIENSIGSLPVSKVLSKPICKRDLILSIVKIFETKLTQPISFFDYSNSKTLDIGVFNHKFLSTNEESRKRPELFINSLISDLSNLMRNIEQDIFKTEFVNLDETINKMEQLANQYGANRLVAISRDMKECVEQFDRKNAYNLVQIGFIELNHLRDFLFEQRQINSVLFQAS